MEGEREVSEWERGRRWGVYGKMVSGAREEGKCEGQ